MRPAESNSFRRCMASPAFRLGPSPGSYPRRKVELLDRHLERLPDAPAHHGQAHHASRRRLDDERMELAAAPKLQSIEMGKDIADAQARALRRPARSQGGNGEPRVSPAHGGADGPGKDAFGRGCRWVGATRREQHAERR